MGYIKPTDDDVKGSDDNDEENWIYQSFPKEK